MTKTRLTAALLLFALGAGALAAAFLAGLTGETIVEPASLEPFERVVFAPARAGLLDVVARDCPGQAPSLPGGAVAWGSLLEDLGWSLAPVTLEDGGARLAGLSLLVAPRAGCLSGDERKALLGYVRNGGGLLAAGLLGARDERGREVGFRLTEELLGAEHVEPLPDGGPALVAFRDGSPLAAGIEALALDPPRRGRVVAVATGPHPYWSDARLQALDATLPPGYQSAALSASFGKGRVAWLGFALDPASGPGQRLLRNAAAWAAGLPVVSVAPWPPPHRSAVLLRANLSGRPRNAAFVARTLLDARVRGAFVVPDDSLDELAGLEPPLSSAGEVALAGRARVTVRVRARSVLGAWPTGLLGGGLTEEEAARAGVAAGLDFYLTEGATGRGRPMVRRATRRWGPWHRRLDIVGFGRLADDDLGLAPLGLAGLQPEWLRRRLLADFEVAAALGALHVLSFHTQGLGAPERVETLSWLVGELVARGTWVAGPAELTAWSRARAGMEMTADATAPGRLVLRLRASAGAPAVPVAVDVHPPPGSHAVVGTDSPDCRVEAPLPWGAQRLVLRVGASTRDCLCDLAFLP